MYKCPHQQARATHARLDTGKGLLLLMIRIKYRIQGTRKKKIQSNNNTGKKIQQIEIWKTKFAQALLVPIIRNMYIIQDTGYKKRSKKYTNKAELDAGKGC